MKKIISVLIAFLMSGFFNILFAFEMPSFSDKGYFISAGDVVSINVSPAEEFSKEVTVQPDGSVDVPLLGSVKVSSLSVSELEKILTAKFSKYVANPTVTVSVRKFSSYKVAAIGQVQRAGYYDYYEGMKILDLIASAGGLADYARTENIRVFRKVKDEKGDVKESSFEVNLSELFSGKLDKNIVLSQGDVIYVPRKKFTSAGKWITDNLLPWTMLATFGLTIGIVSSKR
ncbi:MAG: polysaccharide biosynthesis/export family protein [Elusimicrobiota bacterium]